MKNERIVLAGGSGFLGKLLARELVSCGGEVIVLTRDPSQRAIDSQEMQGVYNATGPDPVTNAQFMTELRHALHRPWSPPVSVWAVHVGSWLMRAEACLALTGRRGLPTRLLDQGFSFKFPRLHDALADIFG